MTDHCAIARCKAEAGIVYLGQDVCQRHWDRFTAEGQPPEGLRMVLGLEAVAPAAMEEPMSDTKKTDPKPTKKAKPMKEAKPKKEKPPKEHLVVFAFRLTPEERDAIHKTAGPAKASRFIRQVAVAFAREDEAAFRAALKEASETRS